MLSEFGLGFWTDALLPVLDQVARSAEGHADRAFWRSFFRYQSGSGPSELTGWIHVLFPYLDLRVDRARRRTANPYLASWERAWQKADARTSWRMTDAEGPSLGEVPSSIASAPVMFVDARDGSKHPLRFAAGLFGVVQDVDSLGLAPEFGWGIVHEPPEGDASSPDQPIP
jgi:hypothetical protein